MQFIIPLFFISFFFSACSSKQEITKPKFTGAYPTGQKYKDVYNSRGYNFGYTL
jgi:hypothetical protein